MGNDAPREVGAARPGAPNSVEPSQNKRAKALDPDLHPWERQPTETEDAYSAFLAFRDMEKRSAKTADPVNGQYWSSVWSWGYRSYHWDLYVYRQDAENMLRYRLDMNERHRQGARIAQAKIVTWLTNLDPKNLKPQDAARWYELAVRVERQAAGSGLDAAVLTPTEPETTNPLDNLTLAEVLGVDEDEAEEALHSLYERLKSES